MELVYKTHWDFNSVTDCVDEAELMSALEKIEGEEFKDYCNDNPDAKLTWVDYLEDADIADCDLLYRIGVQYIEDKEIPCGLALTEYTDGDTYQLIIYQLSSISKEDLEAVVTVYQKEQKLPEMPEPVVEKLLNQ